MTKKTVQVPNLLAGESYAVQVRAVGGEQDVVTSEWSTTFEFTTGVDSIAPAVPANVSIRCNKADFIASWDAVVLDSQGSTLNDLKEYEVQFYETGNEPNSVTFKTNNTTLTLTHNDNINFLGEVSDVSVKVSALDLSGNTSGQSAADSVANVAPSSFSAPTVALESSGQAVTVTWGQPTGADVVDFTDNARDLEYYEVYRKPDGGGGSTKVEDVPFAKGQHTYVDPDPGAGTWVYYVIAYDVYDNFIQSADSASVSPDYSSGGTDTLAPAAPTALVLTGAAVVDSVSGDKAYVDVAFTPPTTNTDASEYQDNAGFMVRYREDGSGDAYEYVSAPDERTGSPLSSATITIRLENLVSQIDYEIGVAAFDDSGNYSSYVSGVETPPVDTTAPPTPAAPAAANDVQSVLVTHDLTDSVSAALPLDVVKLMVYASTGTVTAVPANYLGSIVVVPGFADAVQKFPLPNPEQTPDAADPDSWNIAVTAVDAAGNVSALSASVASTPDLIGGAFIDNATINDAKINSLSANKIVADSAFVNKLFVETELEVNASGFIKSSNWDGLDDGTGSSAGWWLGDTGLVVRGEIIANTGAILGDMTVGANLIIDTGLAKDIYLGDDIMPANVVNTWRGLALDADAVITQVRDYENVWAVRDDGRIYFSAGETDQYIRYDSNAVDPVVISGAFFSTDLTAGKANDGTSRVDIYESAGIGYVDFISWNAFRGADTVDFRLSSGDGITYLDSTVGNLAGRIDIFADVVNIEADSVDSIVAIKSTLGLQLQVTDPNSNFRTVTIEGASGLGITAGDGIAIRPEDNPDTGAPLFQVKTKAGDIQLEVEMLGFTKAEKFKTFLGGSESEPALIIGSADTGIYRDGSSRVCFTQQGRDSFKMSRGAADAWSYLYGIDTTGHIALNTSLDQFSVELASTQELLLGSTGFLVPNVYNATGGGTTVNVQSDGRLVRSSSTIKFKDNLTRFDEVGLIDKIEVFEFDTYNRFKGEITGKGPRQLGLIAENVSHVIPLAGVLDDNEEIIDYDTRAVIALLVKEVQHLRKTVAQMES